jgi:hypothetical protein
MRRWITNYVTFDLNLFPAHSVYRTVLVVGLPEFSHESL